MTVSFIILTYNTSELALQCIDSVHTHLSRDITYETEFIVVDNCSKQEEQDILNEKLPQWCTLIKSRQNVGFGGGNMLGANFASGDYLCFLNSDIIFEQDCITPLLTELEEDKTIGCITPQQYNGERKMVRSFNHEHSILNKVVNKSILEKLFPTHYPSRKQLYDHTFNVHNINGCFMLFPANAFWECGGFDVNIFLYCEEYDVAMRMAKKGYRMVVNPRYSFLHLQGQTTNKSFSLTRREGFISDLYTYRKYHGRISYFIYWLIMFVKVLPKYKIWYVIPVMLCGGGVSRSMRNLRFTT